MATGNAKLISRKITEEVFAVDEELAHGRGAEELDEADDDEDDDADQKPARRR